MIADIAETQPEPAILGSTFIRNSLRLFPIRCQPQLLNYSLFNGCAQGLLLFVEPAEQRQENNREEPAHHARTHIGSEIQIDICRNLSTRLHLAQLLQRTRRDIATRDIDGEACQQLGVVFEREKVEVIVGMLHDALVVEFETRRSILDPGRAYFSQSILRSLDNLLPANG